MRKVRGMSYSDHVIDHSVLTVPEFVSTPDKWRGTIVPALVLGRREHSNRKRKPKDMATHRDGVMTMMNLDTEPPRMILVHNAEGITSRELYRGQGHVLLEEIQTMGISDDAAEVACEAPNRAVGVEVLLERGGGRGLIQ